MKNIFFYTKKGLFIISILLQTKTFASVPEFLNKLPGRFNLNNSSTINKNNYILKGFIKTPQDWKKTPQFQIFFEGKQTKNDKEGFYSFPIEEKLNKFSILFCRHIKKNITKINTIENLKIIAEKPYKIFSFKQTGTDDNIWNQKEKNLTKKNFIIPKNCIVVLMDPKYVDQVKRWNIKLDPNFIKLPQIELKSDLNENQIDRQSAKSILESFETINFHEKIKLSKKDINPKTTAILVQ